MAANLEPILTIADLEAMPEDGNRYELIEGELFVSRAPSLIHQEAVTNLLFAFTGYLREKPIGSVWPGPGVIFSDFTGVIPDIVYVSSERRLEIVRSDRISGAPDLIVEVLSPGPENERRDRQAKRQPYRKYGVKEYWVIDPSKLAIQVYRTSKLRLVATLGVRDEITTPLMSGFRCSVGEIFGKTPR
jgi:Uma2 family endonuclease